MERSGVSSGQQQKDELGEREEQATSKETLKDLEQKKKSSGATGETDEKPPSPDGALDERNELKDTDPI